MSIPPFATSSSCPIVPQVLSNSNTSSLGFLSTMKWEGISSSKFAHPSRRHIYIKEEMDKSLVNLTPEPVHGRKHIDRNGQSIERDWKPSIKLVPNTRNYGSLVFGKADSQKLEKVCEFPRVYRRENLRLLNGRKFSPRNFFKRQKNEENLGGSRRSILNVCSQAENSISRRGSQDLKIKSLQPNEKETRRQSHLAENSLVFSYEPEKTKEVRNQPRKASFVSRRSHFSGDSGEKLPSLGKLERLENQRRF